MQIERSMRNGNHQFCADHLIDRFSIARDNNNNSSSMSSNLLLIPSSPPRLSPNGSPNFIEHQVSKMDTLVGVAIKYGVESLINRFTEDNSSWCRHVSLVSDIKRMNGLVTDLQMFGLKSLQIPLPGRHPPSSSLNGSPTSGEGSIETPPRRVRADVLGSVLGSLQSLREESPPANVSSAMSTLQGYYGLKPPNRRGAEGTEMAAYRGRALYLEDEPIQKPYPLYDAPPSKHRKCRSLVNGFLADHGILTEDVPVAEAGDFESERSNDKSVRRRQKTDVDCPEVLLKEDNSSNGSGFLTKSGKGLALRPKSSSRLAPTVDADSSWLNPLPAGVVELGESILANGLAAVRKSSSTSNLQEQENNGSSSLWPTSKWCLKPDSQARSNGANNRPIFDGLPKPTTGRKNKAG